MAVKKRTRRRRVKPPARNPAYMDADQYRLALKRLKLSQLRLAKLVKVGPRSSRRWALGEARIPGSLAILLKLMLRRKIEIRDIERLE